MNRVFKVIAFFVLCIPIKAQDIPKEYSFWYEEDYVAAEPLVTECVHFLKTTAVGADPIKRIEVTGYFTDWCRGVPYIEIEIYPFITKMTAYNPDLYEVFLAGWVDAYFKNPKAEAKEYYYQGLLALLEVYVMGNGVRKNQDLDHLIKLQGEDKLQKKIEELMNW